MVFGPTVGVALAAFLANGKPANAGEIDLCADAVESEPDPGLVLDLLADDLAGDCAPAELLPDASCEDPPATFWPAAVSACDTPLFKLRRSTHRGPGLAMPTPGRRPLKDVAASDLGSFRASSGPSSPLPEKDLSLSRDHALALTALRPGPSATRIPFSLGSLPPLQAGHARRLERPPEA